VTAAIMPQLKVVAHEPTEYGWRGLTDDGSVLEVKSTNGHRASVPDEVLSQPPWPVTVSDYLARFDRVVTLYKDGKIAEALAASDALVDCAPTLRARFNRAMVALAAGRWHEGFDEYWECELSAPFMRPEIKAALDAGLKPWNGEDLHGKKLLLIHAHGFGDTIMCLRYVPQLQDAVIQVPRELKRLAAQVGALGSDAEYFCPMLHLPRVLRIEPGDVTGEPYLAVEPFLRAQWRDALPRGRKVGVAWSIGKLSAGDFPREIPLKELVAALGDAKVYSVQAQGADEAAMAGVQTYPFADFADCAAFMACMDQVVSVDTAALHLAGATGHPNVVGLLSHWHSWRWLAPWYANVQLVKQEAPDDWSSALEQL